MLIHARHSDDVAARDRSNSTHPSQVRGRDEFAEIIHAHPLCRAGSAPCGPWIGLTRLGMAIGGIGFPSPVSFSVPRISNACKGIS